jgi:TolA-binding protein
VTLSRWILILPILIFGLGVYLYFATENEVRVQFLRAQDHWKDGRYEEAIEAYRSVQSDYPQSKYASRALWELAQLNYVSQFDVNQAIRSFEKLVETYPETPLSRQGLLKLAEIHSIELREPLQAVRYWERYLEVEEDFDQKRQALYLIGNAYFQAADLERAETAYETILSGGEQDELTSRACLQLGSIRQLQNDFLRSVEYFKRALGVKDCPECRLQAQLGLIESLEFLGELPQAIEVARGIDALEYPRKMKADLLARLSEKRKYYEPRLWKSGQP